MAGEPGAFIEPSGRRQCLIPREGLWSAGDRHAPVVLEELWRSTVVEDRPQRAALPAEPRAPIEGGAVGTNEEPLLEVLPRVQGGATLLDRGRLGPRTGAYSREQQDRADIQEASSFHGQQDGSSR